MINVIKLTSTFALIGNSFSQQLQGMPHSLDHIVSTTALSSFSTCNNAPDSQSCNDMPLLDKYSSLLFTQRPKEVQEKIDDAYDSLRYRNTADMWRYKGSGGFYDSLRFKDTDVISQRIQNAPVNKQDLYFIDLGAGLFKWVDDVQDFLHREYSYEHRTFHVIGVSGEGEFLDHKEVHGNIVTHKISGFKLENLLESFAEVNLKLDNAVEFIMCKWTLRHLVDPVGTLEQAYHLLARGNGFLFGNGFHSTLYDGKLDKILFRAFGMHEYIVRETEGVIDMGEFALFRSAENVHSYAKQHFSYRQQYAITQVPERFDSHSQWLANLESNSVEPRIQHTFGGGFYGSGTYVLEQLLGDEEKLISFEGKVLEMPLFKDGLHFLKMYLDRPYGDYFYKIALKSFA